MKRNACWVLAGTPEGTMPFYSQVIGLISDLLDDSQAVSHVRGAYEDCDL
jgi:hypothetical protein